MEISVLIGVPENSALLQPTLNSVSAAVRQALRAGLRCNVTQVRLPAGKDPAPCRNRAIRASRGRYVAWIECGDLISTNWLSECGRLIKEDGRKNLVLHPDCSLLFSGSRKVLRSPDQDSPAFNPAGLVWTNYWSSLHFAEKRLLLKHPFPARQPGFGHEAWTWNCDTVHAGLIHKAVPGTAHFLRQGSAHVAELQSRDWRVPVRRSDYFTSALAAQGPRGEAPPLDTARLDALREEIAPFEPELSRPSGAQLEEIALSDGALTSLFQTFSRQLGDRPDCLFVMHQLRRGGAELEALAHVRALRQALPGARVHFITTEFSDSDWVDHLPKGVGLLPLGRETIQYFAHEFQVRLLQKLLIQARPRAIHVKHSWQCWDLFRETHRSLKAFSKLFASLYCIDYAPDGSRTSFAYSHLRYCWPELQAVFCDNQAMADHLKEICGLKSARVLRFPVMAREESRPLKKKSGRKLRVLWASRLARQKNLDALFSVCDLMPEDEFHAFGEFSEEPSASLTRALSNTPNLKYFGGFDGLDSIDVSQYDAFLYTSHWDGLPNILMEAGVKGLPVLAPRVGGIPELIGPETGFLADTPEEYVRALEELRANPDEAERRTLGLRRLIAKRHSFKAFTRSLRATSGYLGGGRT